MTTYDTLREIRRRTEVIASHDESAMVKAYNTLHEYVQYREQRMREEETCRRMTVISGSR